MPFESSPRPVALLQENMCIQLVPEDDYGGQSERWEGRDGMKAFSQPAKHEAKWSHDSTRWDSLTSRTLFGHDWLGSVFSFAEHAFYSIKSHLPTHSLPPPNSWFILPMIRYHLEKMDWPSNWSTHWRRPKQATIASGPKTWEPPLNDIWRDLS